ncbi:MAG: rod shape-determining protein RodA [Bacteroidales bacterium]|nr:rod shape-determining protein RodA [Bacteroidales bacterium]MBR3730823.1 rod shape-determining protein RodA [Bacteroidales bacterium]MBR6929674.1 rod shape-determining protein RodA [Bacteroidales bacterium]
MNERNSIIGKIDWLTVLIYLVLVTIGWFSIFSAKYDELHPSIFDLSQVYGKQLIWIGASLLVGFIILLIDAKFFNAFSLWIYFFFLASLFVVLVYGKATKGATSWIDLGAGVKFQPSEFAKMATALALAGYLSRLDVDLQKRKHQIVAALLILAPMALVLLQNDTGSAIVFVSFIFVLYREGFPGTGLVMIAGVVAILLFVFTLVWSQKIMYIILGSLFILTLTYYLITKKKGIVTMVAVFLFMFVFVFSVDYSFNKILQEHQRSRIEVLLGMKDDPKGDGYNVHQSKIAIGSGGLTGKGFLQGTQTKYDFVPEQHTDFIFCTVGEEGGFLGTAAVVLLYVALLVRIIILAERQRSTFSRVYGYSIAGIIFVHVAINIGMTIGLVPVIGIPLPFLSYGGSSMLAFTMMLAIFVKQDAYRLNIL